MRLIQKKEGQNKFYKRLLRLDKKIKSKFNKNDSQRSIRAFEIKLHTKISMYDWLLKTKSKFNENQFIKFYVDLGRENLLNKIDLRISKMLKEGAIKEVKKFNKKKIKNDKSANKVIGVNEIKKYLENEVTLDQARELIAIRTRQYAKRQATWARSRMFNWKKIDPSHTLNWIK